MRNPFLPWISGLLLATPLAAQTGTLDQVSPFASEAATGIGTAGFNMSASSLTWQLEAEAGLDGTLEGIELELTGAIGATMDIAVFLGSGWQSGTPVYSGSLSKATGSTEIAWVDMSAANISLSAGDAYMIQLQGNDTGMGTTGTYESPVNMQFDGDLYLNSNLYGPEWKVGFHTYILEDALQLAVGGTCGGFMDFDLTGATPMGAVTFLRAAGTGSFVLPIGPCAGTSLGLDATTQFVVTLTADAAGSIGTTRGVPAAACGRVYVQAIDVATCATSNVVLLQ